MSPTMKRWSVILFDLDNTLYNNKLCWIIAIRESISHLFGTIHFDIDRFYQLMRIDKDKLSEDYRNRYIDLLEYRKKRVQLTAKACQFEMSDSDALEFLSLFSEKVVQSASPFPGMRKTLDYLSNHYRMGIITNGPADYQYHIIKQLSIDDLFDEHNVVISGKIGHAKPSKEIFLYLLDMLKARPEETLVIGDSWKQDVVGALDSGMEAIWINTMDESPTSEHQPLAVIQHFNQLLPLIKNYEPVNARPGG